MGPVEGWEVVGSATPEQVAFYREHGSLKFGRIFTAGDTDDGHGWKIFLLRGMDRTGGRTLYTPLPEVP